MLTFSASGAKADPTRVRIGDLSDCGTDPLARLVRKVLRKQHKIENGVPVLLSVEPPRCQLQPAPDNAQDYQVSWPTHITPQVDTVDISHSPARRSYPASESGRYLCLDPCQPSLAALLPASSCATWLASRSCLTRPSGCRCAAHCKLQPAAWVQQLTGWMWQAKQYQTLLDRLCQREEASFGHSAGVDVDVDDVRPPSIVDGRSLPCRQSCVRAQVAFLMRTVYRGLSARGPRYAPTAHDWGTNRLTDHLTLTR